MVSKHVRAVRRNAEFEAAFLATLNLIGDLDLLAYKWPTSGTSMTSDDYHGDTLTPVPGGGSDFNAYDIPPSALGRNGGMQLHLNGTDEYVSVGDEDRYSWGDGAVDTPKSVVALINPGDITATGTIISKWDESGSTDEWWYRHNGSGRMQQFIADPSASTSLGIGASGALTEDAWVLVSMSYDASKAEPGITHYKNGAVAALAAGFGTTPASYVAAEAGATVVTIGSHEGVGGSQEEFFPGAIGFVAIYNKELTLQDNIALTKATNAYYGTIVSL